MNNEEKILVLLEQHSEMFAQINSRRTHGRTAIGWVP